jgi:hypothetical protein
MRKLIASLLLLCICHTAEARLCEEPSTCGNTVSCISELKGFTSYAAFKTWLLQNPCAEYDVVYATSTNITIVWWTDNCNYKEGCLDGIGECALN